jgi:parallel beta-helix repeat protein
MVRMYMTVELFIVMLAIANAQNSQVFLVGDHPDATHYVAARNDIYNITQTLLNKIAVAGNGTLKIANGTYILSKNIETGNNTHINGFGMYETILQLADFADKFVKAGFVRTVRTRNIYISNLTLDGNKHRQIIDGMDNDLPSNVSYDLSTRYGRYGLFTEGCFNVTFDTVRIMNFQGYGFDPHGQKKSGTYGDGLLIKNCLSTHNNWDGFTLDQTKNIYVVNCTSRSNGRHGFNIVTGSANVSIVNSTSFVDGYYYPTGSGCGVQVQNNQGYPTNTVYIEGMLIIDPNKGGICMNGVSKIFPKRNRIYGKTCFRIETSSTVSISNNTCFNSNPSTRFVMNSRNSNVNISNTMNMTDTISTYSGQNLTIIVGYSNKATIKVRQDYDAYSIFQQAFDEIKANGRGRLYIEEGNYTLSSFLEVGDNVTVVGAGMNKTILKLEDFTRPWWIPGTGTRRSGFLRSTSCVNLSFYNLTVDGNKDKQNTDKYSKYGRFGFFTEACDNVYVNGMGVINFQGYGFDPHGVKATKTWSKNLTIVNSYSANNDWDGFTIDQSENVLLRNNLAVNNGRHGFNIVTGTRNITIEENKAYNNGYYYYLGNEGCGIMVQNNLNYSTQDVVVRHNILVNSNDAGICANDVIHIIVTNNTVIQNNTVACIKTKSLTNAEVKDNYCNLVPKPLSSPLPRPPSPSPMKRTNSSNTVKISLTLLMLVASILMVALEIF